MTDRRAVRSEGPDPTRERVIEVFGRGGALANAVAGFVPRASQADMAATVYDAIQDGATLVAEAGTGVGKSLAYLLPAARFALETGRKAVIYSASDDGWQTARDLAAAGADVAAIVDPRAEVPAACRALAEAIGARVVAGGTPAQVAPLLGRAETDVVTALKQAGFTTADAATPLSEIATASGKDTMALMATLAALKAK